LIDDTMAALLRSHWHPCSTERIVVLARSLDILGLAVRDPDVYCMTNTQGDR